MSDTVKPTENPTEVPSPGRGPSPAPQDNGGNIDWNNAITGSMRNAVDLSLDDLRRQGVRYTNTNTET